MVVLACILVFGAYDDVQAQSRGKKGSKPRTSAQARKGKGKQRSNAKTAEKAEPKESKPAEPPAPSFIELPYNSNDCMFAIPLEIDKPYGPTSAPHDPGNMLEGVADKAHPDLFETEHNSVWYKVKIPYNGQLEIRIEQINKYEDYDFMVYRYTDKYFPNHVMLNKVLPVAVNLATVDTLSTSEATMQEMNQRKPRPAAQQSRTPRQQQPATDEPPAFQPTTPVSQPAIGMLHDAKDVKLTKNQIGSFIKSIPVKMGEEYYIVLDSRSDIGQGHTITVSVYADAFEPLVLFYDRKARKYVDVNLQIVEMGGESGRRIIVKDENYRGGRVKFVPGFNYTLYARKEGFFSIMRHFNTSDLMQHDTIMLYNMERTEKGSVFQISDLYFEDGEGTLIGNYDTVLNNYLGMFLNHPEVYFTVKGYVQSYGVNMEADMLLSLERAKAVKQYFVDHGIDANRIYTAGMTQNEIKRAADAVLDGGGTFSRVKIELIVTDIKVKD